jgi:DNA-3-methyladenine glycosylase II
VITRVAVRAPYRLDLTANVLRRLSTNVVDRFDGTTYCRLIGDAHARALLSVTQTGPSEITVDIDAPAGAYDAQVLAERMLGIGVDLAPFYGAAAGVAWLAPLVAGARGVKPPRYPTVWEACVNAIVYQQISIHAAGAILRRVI